MKSKFIFFTLMLFTFHLEAQIMSSWSTPIALTDSTSNSSNPVIVVWDDEVYMIYNKYNEPYRQIWWRKISEPMSEEQMLVGGWPEVDYRNPHIFFNSFLVCEMNPEGQYDLFGFRIDTSGILGSGFQITNTGYDENCFTGYYSNYEDLCCWESEGIIYVAELQIVEDTLIFTDIEIIDTGYCHEPVVQENYIAWRKIENNESHIYYSEKEWPYYQWSYPEAIVDTGDNINLSLSIAAPETYSWKRNLCWEANNMIYLSSYCPVIPEVEKYHDPTAFDIAWLTDNYYGVYSFVGETGSISDIYIVDEVASNYVVNITDDSIIDKNPRFFIGRPMYEYSTDYEIINIWQKEINGKDVLYFSYALYDVVIDNIGENVITHLNIMPNPVSGESYIQIILSEVLPEDISISILNNQGHKMDEIRVEGNNSVEFRINWNKGDLPAGIYYILVRNEGKSIIKKFIVL